jgi:hypothetical protein
MPHNPDDIGVNINDYLGALGRYNQQFGGNQGNQVISSATAPGYAYQNPQTQEIYPLYPEGTEPQGPPQGGGFSGGEGRFHDYLNSIGATKRKLGFNRNQIGYFSDTVDGKDQNFVRRSVNDPVDRYFPVGTDPGFGPSYNFGDVVGSGTYGGWGADAYVADNKFLGYAGTPDELFAKSSPLLQRQYYESLYS